MEIAIKHVADGRWRRRAGGGADGVDNGRPTGAPPYLAHPQNPQGRLSGLDSTFAPLPAEVSSRSASRSAWALRRPSRDGMWAGVGLRPQEGV